MHYEPVSSSVECEPSVTHRTQAHHHVCLEVVHEGEVCVRCATEQEFQHVWFSLAADDTLTIRSKRGGPVLRTANARLCQVNSVRSRPSPCEHAFSVTLQQVDSEGNQLYVISLGALSDVNVSVDVDTDHTACDFDQFDQHPAALRKWIEVFSAAASRLSGAWRWHFAVVFGLVDTDNEQDPCVHQDVDAVELAKAHLHKVVEEWCLTFHRWRFEIAIAERTEQTKDRIMVLLRMDDCDIEKFFHEVETERWEKSADGITLRKSKSQSRIAETDLQLTAQDRVATMAHVISTYCKLGDIEHLHDRVHPWSSHNTANDDDAHWSTTSVDPRIIDIFPLKDEEWIRNMDKLWVDRGGVLQSVKGMKRVLNRQRQNVHQDIVDALKMGKDVPINLIDGIEETALEAGGLVKDAVIERVQLIDSSAWESPFVRSTILVRGIAEGTAARSFEAMMERHLCGCECLQGTVRNWGGLVTLDSEDCVQAVLAAFDSGLDLSLERLADTARDFTRNHPRDFNEACAKATAKAAAKLATKTDAMTAERKAKLRKWQPPDQRTSGKRESDTPAASGFCSVLRCQCAFSPRDLCSEFAHAFSHRDDDILTKMCEEYGPKVAIYFAFLNSYTTSTGLLAVVGSVLFVLAWTLEWLAYLRCLGIIGLLAASVWGPLATVLWRRRAAHLIFEWQMKDSEPEGVQGVNLHYSADKDAHSRLGHLAVLVLPSLAFVVANRFSVGLVKTLAVTFLLAWCLKPQTWPVPYKLKKGMVIIVTIFFVLLGIVTVLAFNFLLIEYTQYLTTLPLCDTYFHRVFEVQNDLVAGGLFSTNSSYFPFGPDCFHSISTNFWTWRGFLILLIGVISGLLIDVVWDIVFQMVAEYILNEINIKKQVDYEYYRVAVYFPFMWSAFMSYFLLAAAMVPFGPYIDPLLLQYISWLTTSAKGAVDTVNRLGKAVTDTDKLQDFVDDGLSDLGLTNRSHLHLHGSCPLGITTLAGSAGGPQPSTACSFPLRYCDVRTGECETYYECTADASEMPGRPWCATRSIEAGGWEDDNWGYCDCSGQPLDGSHAVLDSARVDDLMSYWRYNHRTSISLDTLMIGPLVVAVWLDFVFKNLIPLGEFHRRRFLALRRGRKIGCCARTMVWITCCCGFHDGKPLQECVGTEDNWEMAREEFVQTLEQKLKGRTSRGLDSLAHSAPTGSVPPRRSAQKKVMVVKSIAAHHREYEDSYQQQDKLHKSMFNKYRFCKCCAGSCFDPNSCCVLRCKWCRCRCCDQADEELDMNRYPANYLLVESSMRHYDNFFEYAELVGQFSYVTMFTVVFPLGAVMALLRNLFEAQWDASRMWRDFKRPVPRRPSLTNPLGGWEQMIATQTTLSCLFTSAFFVFCTGQLEAWFDLFNDYGISNAEKARMAGDGSGTSDSETLGSAAPNSPLDHWGNCQPVSMNASIWWSYGKLDDSQSHCNLETRCETDFNYDFEEKLVTYMAPNYNCWEVYADRVPEESMVCEWKEHDFVAAKQGMGFHQLAVRLLTWLILNHIQIFISRLIFSCLPEKTEEQKQKERTHEIEQRKLITSHLFCHQTEVEVPRQST